jgi:F0F1-type ATP synthase assembly protein I
MTDTGASRAGAAARAMILPLVGSVMVAVKLPAGKPFAVALTMMLVFTLIGLVLGVLIPRRAIDASEPAGVNTAPTA